MQNYAMIENGVVANVIWLSDENAGDFPAAIPLEDRPATIGDAYADGVFTRAGEPVLTPIEQAQATIAALDAQVIQLEYNNIMLELGLEV